MLRDRLPIAVVTAPVLLAAVALGGCPGGAQKTGEKAAGSSGGPCFEELIQRDGKIVAQVGPGGIPDTLFANQARDKARILRRPAVKLDAKQREGVLDPLIREELLVQYAIKSGMVASDPYVRQRLANSVIEGIQKEARAKQAISSEEVQAFYEKHKERFKVAAQVRASHIHFRVSAKSTEKEKEAVKRKAELVLRKVAQQPETFEEQARQHGTGPAARRGGDLGWFTRDRMAKSLSDAAFALQKGEMSPVVESPHGFHILKILDRKPEHYEPLATAERKIRSELRARSGDTAVDDFVANLRSEYGVSVDSAAMEAALKSLPKTPAPNLLPPMPGKPGRPIPPGKRHPESAPGNGP